VESFPQNRSDPKQYDWQPKWKDHHDPVTPGICVRFAESRDGQIKENQVIDGLRGRSFPIGERTRTYCRNMTGPTCRPNHAKIYEVKKDEDGRKYSNGAALEKWLCCFHFLACETIQARTPRVVKSTACFAITATYCGVGATSARALRGCGSGIFKLGHHRDGWMKR
jgi:hypothetical protein